MVATVHHGPRPGGDRTTLSRREWAVAWVVAFVLATVSGILRFFYFALDDVARAHLGNVAQRLIEEGTGTYAALPLEVFVAWLALRVPLDRARWRRHVWVHVAALLVVAVTHTSLMWASRLAIFSAFGLGHYDYGAMPVRYAMELPQQALGYVWVLLIVAVYSYWRRARDRELDAVRFERGLATAELHNLRLQLQPHFLFNALNTISSTMYDDPRAADRMIGQLAELLRMSLRTSHAQEVPLREELEVLGAYVDIMRARFGDRLRFTIDVGADVERAMVPSLLLQPLVENAVRHGGASRRRGCAIMVTAERRGTRLALVVADDGDGAPEGVLGTGGGVGLSATADRLRLMYGPAHRFEAGNRTDGRGFQVAIELPLRASPAGAPNVNEVLTTADVVLATAAAASDARPDR